MNPGKSNTTTDADAAPDVKARVIARRAFLPFLIFAAGGAAIPFAIFRQWRRDAGVQALEPNSDCLIKPRYRPAKHHIAPSRLERGFYLYPKSQVIHYVSEDRRLRGATSIDEAGLTRQDPDPAQRNAGPSEQRPHVNRGCASYAFELESLALLKQNQADKACELLAYAVEEDLRRVSLSGGPPSIRLYDLLAGVSLRTGRTKYLDEMIHRIDDAARRGSESSDDFAVAHTPYTVALQARIRKWKDPRSRWHRRWSDKAKKVTWKRDKDNGLVF